MSTAVAQVSTTSVGSYATSRVVASFTPTANAILIGLVVSPDSGMTVSGISGHGTWSAIRQSTGSGQQVDLWACKVGASPSASAVTASHNSVPSLFAIFELSADYAAASVAAAVVQSAQQIEYVTGTPANHSLSVALSAFGDATNNLALIVAAISSGSTMTPEGSLTSDFSYTTAPYSIRMASLIGEDTSPSILSTADYCHNVAIAAEFAYVGGGGGGSTKRRLTTLGV